MAAGVFSVFGGQPLCIAGVTGTVLDAEALENLLTVLMLAFHHRSYYRPEQDNLQRPEQDLESPGLPAVYGTGIPLGCDIPLDVGSSKRPSRKTHRWQDNTLTSSSNLKGATS